MSLAHPALPSRLPALIGCACTFAQAQTRSIEWGTTLEPRSALASAKALAKSVVDPTASNWRAKGDQKRTYRFAQAGVTSPYRLCVPSSWDGRSPMALVMFLHGAGNDESSYLDANNKQMVTLANQHGVVLVSPKGVESAYGSFLRLPAVFGKPAEVAPMLAKRTDATETANQLSELDVLNVLELVKAEYPIDTTNMFLTGHSMGSGGTWYLGGKYSELWRGLAPLSGPFVTETGYPWDRVLTIPVFVTEGTNAASLEGSRTLKAWMENRRGLLKYKEVSADHAGMVPLVLPAIYDYIDSLRLHPSDILNNARSHETHGRILWVHQGNGPLRIPSASLSSGDLNWSVVDLHGRQWLSPLTSPSTASQPMATTRLPAGVYMVRWESP
ncbi:MAG: hypothetical protein IPK50_18950 [Fibrobacterota bacterium]|nr:MAG: hypothetical protein IPK50_18950 [Fibrobacterota bacterium]